MSPALGQRLLTHTVTTALCRAPIRSVETLLGNTDLTITAPYVQYHLSEDIPVGTLFTVWLTSSPSSGVVISCWLFLWQPSWSLTDTEDNEGSLK